MDTIGTLFRRYGKMRGLLILSIIVSSFGLKAQNCTPNIAVKVNICKRVSTDSTTAYCVRGAYGLSVSDSNFTITGFAIRAEGPGFDEYIEEAINTGSAWNEARRILIKVRAGSLIEFTCIKAKYKDSDNVYVLQPLTLTLR